MRFMTTNKPSFVDQPARQLLLSVGAARLCFGAQALAMNAFALAGARLLAGSMGGFGVRAEEVSHPVASKDVLSNDTAPKASASATHSRSGNSLRTTPARRRTAKK